MISGDDEIASAGEIEAFVQRWSLDSGAQKLVWTLDPAVQKRIINQFSPSDTTRGASAALTGFVRSVLKTVTPVNPHGLSEDEMLTFALQWDLDERATGLLESLDPDIQARVVRDFAPSDVQKGASVAFMGFVKAVQGSSGRAMPSHTGGAPSQDRGAEQAFINQWDLDGMAQEALLRLDPASKQRVMRDFSPKDVSRGASAAFMGFVKSVANSGPRVSAGQAHAPSQAVAYGAGPGAYAHGTDWNHSEMLKQFIQKWDLDKHAQEALLTCDPAVAQKVIDDFAPKDVSRGASAAFMGFLKSVSRGQPSATHGYGQAAHSSPGHAAYDASGGFDESDPIASFAARWDLDAGAVQTLRNLEPDTQQKIMEGFAPQNVKRGASIAFMGFVKSVVSAAGQQMPSANFSKEALHESALSGESIMDKFIAKWALDETAQQALHGLDPVSQQRVIDGFAPRDVKRGASIAFMGFVRSLNGVGAASPQGQMATPGIDEFVETWGLDSKAEDALRRLDATMQARAMNDFKPRDVSRGASIPFMGFVKSMNHQAPQQYAQAAIPAGPMTTSFGSASTSIRAAVIEAFVIQWGLDRMAQEALSQLDPASQQRVMDGFAPKDVSRGASAAFMGFVRSVGQSPGGKGNASKSQGWHEQAAPQPAPVWPSQAPAYGQDDVSTFIGLWQLDSMAEEALRRLDPRLQQRVISQFSPKDVSRGASIPFMGFLKSVANSGPLVQQPSQAAPGGSAALEAFAAQWGLDEKAQDALYRLDADMQTRVMTDFLPKDTSRGASAAFMGFVRSVGGKGGGKEAKGGGKAGKGARYQPY